MIRYGVTSTNTYFDNILIITLKMKKLKLLLYTVSGEQRFGYIISSVRSKNK